MEAALIVLAVWLALNVAIVVIRLLVTADRPASAERDMIRYPGLSHYQASENR